MSKKVSAVPSKKKAAYISGMLAKSKNVARPSTPITADRKKSATAITRRRSIRFTSAPLTSENNSHGSR